jgi:hypothetical protein
MEIQAICNKQYSELTYLNATDNFFHGLQLRQYLYHIVSNGRMTEKWWIGKDVEGSGCCLIEVLFHIFLEGLKKSG